MNASALTAPAGQNVEDGPVPVNQIWAWLENVMDPEVPVLSVVDLGIVRELRWAASLTAANGTTTELELQVSLTPTYSGCPAVDVINHDIRQALLGHGVPAVTIHTRLAPAWTTDWLSPAGRRKLREYGIAPPAGKAPRGCITRGACSGVKPGPRPILRLADIPPPQACPHCGSTHTRLISHAGSTACKALYVCDTCREPFDYFKPH